MPSLDIGRISLRELGELVGLHVTVTVADRAGFEAFLHVPLRRLRAEFRTPRAFGAFVLNKLDQAEERARVRRIAALFSNQDNPQELPDDRNQ